ncbi:lysophospholipase L1-like esterase [Microbacteriaceae bacterium SG_E_30_P1]|uniref:Lysophospholipase L1-like esterase n=1 Tax=Antiquaquibacter oligotrophicus TaxID=2880260 RepID=A0ABT6KRA6_9MICO|nr:SGNH/GDSL hydrolase family protein [Antiquaquibacter oligotrophicus]MDH6182511.1 lysophospholipase L1-like esterase [Antiquaquibacter oligotrophicus]UDF14519.1 SGNH/GDSL hydrolase family protein [Antiquaquibacter oligotrophicus]
MNGLQRLSRLAVIPAGAVVFVQGRRLRRDTPRLPDAAAPWFGEISGPRPLRLLVLGDSTAAGVGAPTQDEALPGHLARALRNFTGRGIRWRAIGENGVDAREFIERYLDEATTQPWDVVLVSLGANDALGLRSRRAFSRDIRVILDRIRSTSPDARILVSSLPAFARFELLPNPLRWNLSLHARNLEAGARAVVATVDGAHMAPPPPPYTEGFFATDLFHPSAQGYRDWARFAVDDAVSAGVLDLD